MFGASDDEDGESFGSAAPFKKSLFNRPVWAQTQSSEVKEPTDIFSHSSRVHAEIVAEQERKRHKQHDKNRPKLERRDSSSKIEKREKSEPSSAKKRRISAREGLALLDELISTEPTDRESLDRSRCRETSEDVRPQSTRSGDTRGVEHIGLVKRHQRQPDVIDLGNSSDNGVQEIPNAEAQAQKGGTEEDEDEEFAELARQARKRRWLNVTDSNKHRTQEVIVKASTPGSGVAEASHLPTPPPDPVVQLFISSRLPNAKPLIVHRKLSQNLQQIREVWCEKQGMSKEEAARVFFIYKLRRLYDVTTCKSLGLQADSFGNVTMRGAEGMEGVEKIHLEAVTDELFSQIKEEKAQEERNKRKPLIAEAEAESTEEDKEAAAKKKAEEEAALVRLLLKAKGKDDFKLKVKPTTLISKIISAYKRAYDLAEELQVFLEFDGERLVSTEEIQGTDVSDMDCLDVHIA